MTSFQELNENLNEFYLIKECIKYVGNISIELQKKLEKQHDKYIRIFKHFDDEMLYDIYGLSLDFIRYYQNEINWYFTTYYIRSFQLNNIEFVREFQDKLNWGIISEKLKYFKLNNIEFIREFQDKLDWNIISNDIINWELNNNIDFLREFQDKLNWYIY
jgi:hypothetical protein